MDGTTTQDSARARAHADAFSNLQRIWNFDRYWIAEVQFRMTVAGEIDSRPRGDSTRKR